MTFSGHEQWQSLWHVVQGMLRLPSAIGRIRNKRLEEYLASLEEPNAFGYRPVALEWDLW